MKYKTMLAMLFVLAFLVTACAPQAIVPTMTTEPTMAPTEPSMTEAPTVGEATVSLSESTEFGPILVDDEGLSLYIFMNDTQNGESSSCNDECAVEWPPLLSQGSPIAGEGVDSTLLGTVIRADGALQVTYNGWPLYHFDEDTAPGDTNGQGMENLWFLVTPTGEAVQQ